MPKDHICKTIIYVLCESASLQSWIFSPSKIPCMEGKEVGETEISKKLCMFHICRFLNSTFLMTLLSIWRVSLSQNFYSQLCARRRAGTWRCGTRQRQWIPMGPTLVALLQSIIFLSSFIPSSFLVLCVHIYIYVCMILYVLGSRVCCPSCWLIATLNNALLCDLWISKRVKRFKWQDLNEKIVILQCICGWKSGSRWKD